MFRYTLLFFCILSLNAEAENTLFTQRFRAERWFSRAEHIEASIYRVYLKRDSVSGFEIKTGVDEHSLPLWSSGTFRAGIVYDFAKLSVHLPYDEITDVITHHSKRRSMLDGTTGATLELEGNRLGAHGGMGFLEVAPRNFDLTRDTLHSMNLWLTAFWMGDVPFERGSGLRIAGGLGYKRITTSTHSALKIIPEFNEQLISGYAKVDYLGATDDVFEHASAQFAGDAFEFTFTFRLPPSLPSPWNNCGLEGRFAWRTFRDRRSWEAPDMFFISPRIVF